MGQLLATLPTCAHLSPDSQRLHRAGSVPCKPKTLKNECLRHIFPYCATPKGLANTRGRCPHPRSPRGRGAGKTSCTLTTERCRLQPVKASPLRGCFASLDRFPAPSASVSFATPTEMERGSRGDEVVHFTLDALESTPTLTVGVGG